MGAAAPTVAALSRVGLASLAGDGGPLPVVRLRRGEVLLRTGEEPDAVYAVLRGRLRVHPGEVDEDPGLSLELGPGAIVGETAVLVGGQRLGTVVAAVATSLVRIEAERFASLLGDDPELAQVIAAETAERLRWTSFARHVTALVGEVSGAELVGLRDRCSWVRVTAGTELFREGDPGDAAYLVLTGRLRATIGSDAARRTLGMMGPGSMIGEAALVDGGRRSATVTADRDSELARLDRATLEDVLRDHPRAGLAIVRQAVERSLGGELHRRPGGPLSVAVVPLGRGVDVRLFASALTEHLGALGTVTHLWSARIDDWLDRPGTAHRPPEDPSGLRLDAWLQGLETGTDRIVYEVDPAWTGWTRRALRWSDVVLFVGDGREDPAVDELTDEVHAALRRHHRRAALVLLHDGAVDRPRRTGRWLEQHPADEVHHVRQGAPADTARLARVVAGTANGLVLSGGGARGFAHLGVLKALEEHGVPVDVVGGTSIGAVIASGCALGHGAVEMTGIAAEHFRRVLDYTVPVVSMVSGQRIVRAMREVYGDRDIEDLWRTYFCISANLTRSETVVHRRGPLVDAVRASVAIPGVIPPVPHGDDLLVDGGVLNNLPLDELLATGLVGTSVAVDVTPREGPRAKSDYGLSVSGVRVLTGRLGGRHHPAPGIARVLLRSMLLGAMRDRDRQVAAEGADLFLELDLRGVDMLDFSSVERVAASGYEAAAPRIAAWLEGSDA